MLTSEVYVKYLVALVNVNEVHVGTLARLRRGCLDDMNIINIVFVYLYAWCLSVSMCVCLITIYSKIHLMSLVPTCIVINWYICHMPVISYLAHFQFVLR